MPGMVRQGGVLLVRVDELPDCEPVARDGAIVLARGEVSGHAHRVVDPHAIELRGRDGARYLRLPVRAEVTHEEHRALTLEPGDYRIVLQREYVPRARPRAAHD